MWLVPRDQVPADPDAQVDWLYGWWKRVDEWIAAHQPGGGEAA
jgi:hypothetical protein